MVRLRNVFITAVWVLACAVSGSACAGIIYDDREWYQPADVTGYSWDEFFAVCGAGPCNGHLGGGGPDLTGWTWASVYDVGALFHAASPHPGGIYYYIDSTPEDGGPGWAYDFLSPSGLAGFIPTVDISEFPFFALGVSGLTSSREGSNPYLGVLGLQGYPSPTRPFEIEIDGVAITALAGFDTSTGSADVGAWLYRSAVIDVAAPPTWLLLLEALAGLGRVSSRSN